MNVYICLAASVVLCEVELASVTRSDAVTGRASLRTNATQKTNNFVEVIKKDLKRNNDDYKDLTTESKLIITNKLLDFTIKTVPVVFDSKVVNVKNNVKTFRRTNDRSYEYYDFLNKEPANNENLKSTKSTSKMVTYKTPRLRNLSPGLNFMPPVHNQSVIENLNGVMLPLHKPSPGIVQNIQHTYRPSTASKLVNKRKIDKFKQFVEKNKKLFQEYLSTQVDVLTPKALLRQLHANENKQNKLKEQKKMMKSKVWSDDNIDELPNGDLLDMAPGTGVRIHKQRVKGRICHRHVLMPEGPKYDSAGRGYLPAHARAARRPFERTREPALLLPRCCNCCKKSVLGCE
ncbi:unnamed protein product, partial [Brenthis ino]